MDLSINAVTNILFKVMASNVKMGEVMKKTTDVYLSSDFFNSVSLLLNYLLICLKKEHGSNE